ncbi:MAG: vitamin K epoxide reductase family protein [bacterium]|nr:vitamin K epoxide reductase family protein [bacterium]
MIQRRIKKLAIAFTVFAAIGFFDSTYLTMKRLFGGVVPCLTGGCELVATSEYAVILGIPVALLGAIYYLSQLILIIAYFESKSTVPLRLAAQLTIIGLLASLYFVSLQLFVIHAICDKCMLSAISSTVMFFLGLSIQKHLQGRNQN